MSPRFQFLTVKPLWVGLVTTCLAGFSTNVLAQPELFGGDPDSSTFTRISDNTDDWTRHFRLGAMVAMNISAKFGLSANYNFGLNGSNPSQGIYDDGYVHPDKSGDTASTGYWGYRNASQYNAANNTLSFHSASSYTLADSAQSSQDGGFIPGLDLSYGGNLWYWKHARVGWELGFGLLPFTITDNNVYGINAAQNTYVFNVPSASSGFVMPSAPYSGGNSVGNQPLISLNYAASSTNSVGTLGGSRSLDVMYYTLRLGPTFYWDISEKFAAYFGAGPAVGLVDGELKYNDVVTINGTTSRGSGGFSSTDFTYGGYVNGTLLYHWNDNADLYLGVQYMPMGSVDFSGGGRQAQLDLSGQLYLSAGIHWPF